MKYFTIDEMCRSNTAKARKIDNTPNEEVKKNLQNLIEHILDPLREKYGKPIVVSSGYRSEKLNRAIGGSKTSQHCIGQAADIHATVNSRKNNMEIFKLIKECIDDWDQLIYEHGDNTGPDWIHISYSSKHNRKQILKAISSGGRTKYISIK